jgi:hypothetical protein
VQTLQKLMVVIGLQLQCLGQSIVHGYLPANPHFLSQRAPISLTKLKLKSLKDTEFIYGKIGGRLLVAIHLDNLQNKTLAEGDPISSTTIFVKSSEVAESYGVSNKNFCGYNPLFST